MHGRFATVVVSCVALAAVGFAVQRVSMIESKGKKSIAPESSSVTLIPAVAAELASSVGEECTSQSSPCFARALGMRAAAHGPAVVLEAFIQLQQRGIATAAIDEHQIAHEIGRQTARAFGINGPAFVLCPTTYNNGCQHGFFEHALGQAATAADAADRICSAFSSTHADKFVFTCYHGVGHGMLMARAYDLSATLGECDALDAGAPREGCWQGVFMENGNAAIRGEARPGLFSETDPLAPCNRVADHYRHECFINHAGWLSKVFNRDLARAATACLAAPAPHHHACLQSLGLMVSNPTWQTVLVQPGAQRGREATAWTLCESFPAAAQQDCVQGAVGNIMNFDELTVTGARIFCEYATGELRTACFAEIGQSLRRQTRETEQVRATCEMFLPADAAACLRAADLSVLR